MKVAMTGAKGFVGGNLARDLADQGHKVVRITRPAPGPGKKTYSVHFFDAPIGLADEARLSAALAGCEAVVHCAGINRELGRQTYRRVHVEGTRNVVNAARKAGVKKIVLLSFLRARPDCGSKYHESKWAAEEIVRGCGLDYTILKAGVIYGRGDHMLDHLSHAFHTFPVFALVGMKEQLIRPTAVEDIVRILRAAVVEGRLSRQTVAVIGPEELTLSAAVKRVAHVVGQRPWMVRLPLFFHYGLGWVLERIMKVPLVSLAQVRILSEGIVEPAQACDPLPDELTPKTFFSEEQIRRGLPEPKRFGLSDLRCCAGIRP